MNGTIISGNLGELTEYLDNLVTITLRYMYILYIVANCLASGIIHICIL